ncbi:MerR family transcriptional regulator ['Paenibacillus yunnanensis' Narsing Rao et al. 2020]|uniref:MerR family transcriptional regulator n=1 Tax=Paenibacillus tengchongensis TaxID=2608684 RepID=UPI00124EAFC5|nr:MerR family transcriptional regulator [Paenibacillus tengchongensis]
MRIKEVCAVSGLTRKAVEYYERQGLLTPESGENGYRMYSSGDVARLQEISLLRKLGIGVPDIREIVGSSDRQERLAAVRARMELQQQQGKARLQAVELLIADYRPEQLAGLAAGIEEAFTIREKLLLAFPGGYGRYLSAHFGRFLDFSETGTEQRQAYADIVGYLDRLELSQPMDTELSALLEQYLPAEDDVWMKESGQQMEQALQDIDGYLKQHKEEIDAYIAFRRSDGYKNSPAFRLGQLLREFQQGSGYADIFIPAMKRLSPSYRAYSEELEAANRLMLERYPDSRALMEPGTGNAGIRTEEE